MWLAKPTLFWLAVAVAAASNLAGDGLVVDRPIGEELELARARRHPGSPLPAAFEGGRVVSGPRSAR